MQERAHGIRGGGACLSLGLAILLISLGLLLSPDVGLAQAGATSEYDCKIIASTDEFPEGFFGLLPSLNRHGRVAFEAQLGPDLFGIYTGIGEIESGGDLEIDQVALAGGDALTDLSVEFLQFGSAGPRISGSGMVSFAGTRVIHQAGGATQLEGSLYQFHVPTGSLLRSLDDSCDATTTCYADGPVPINSLNYQAFWGSRNNVFGLYWVESAGGEGILETNSPTLQINFPEFALHPGILLSTAFTAGDLLSGDFGVYLNGGRIASDSTGLLDFRGVSINGGLALRPSHVAYIQVDGEFFPSTYEVHLWRPGGSTILTSSAQTPYGGATPHQTSTNHYGEVVFGGNFGGDPLYIADEQSVREVVCRDQFAVFGTDFFSRQQITSNALNSSGQITFYASTGVLLPSGTFESWIVRADPFEHTKPEDCAGLANDTICDDNDPDTISFCEAGACVGIPIPEPSAIASLVSGLTLLVGMAGSLRRPHVDTGR